jgi:hypothetical protein
LAYLKAQLMLPLAVKKNRMINSKTIARTFKRKGLKSAKEKRHFHLTVIGKKHDMIGQRLIKTGSRLVGNRLSFLMRQKLKRESNGL